MASKCLCEWCNNTNIHAKGYCAKHYAQIREFGSVKRTKYDPNTFIVHEDKVEIQLFDAFGNYCDSTFIDVEDMDKVVDYKWRKDSNGYVVNNKIGFLHRVVMNPLKNEIVDHINHNTLDNRKCNLRVCNHSQNACNSYTHDDNKSGFKNVVWNSKKAKWQVIVSKDGKKFHGGFFNDVEEARMVAKELRGELHGEYAYDGGESNE